MREQVQIAIDLADVIVFLTDIKQESKGIGSGFKEIKTMEFRCSATFSMANSKIRCQIFANDSRRNLAH